jgi:predicted transcriptional regulator of viral defense system
VLAGYALRFRSQALAQRLGYLADLLSLPRDGKPRERLLRASGRNTCYLGQPGRWRRGGNYRAI